MTHRLKKTLYVLGCLLVLGGILGGYLIGLQVFGNFHEVLPGEVYRSAQLSPDQLRALNAQYNFKTILNLRGERDGEKWYDQEKQESETLGLKHLDFEMSDSAIFPLEQAQKLVETMETAPKPLLIHCRAGADRSGLAAALYLAAIAKKGEGAAEKQLSIVYGHFSLPFLSRAYSMDESFEKLESWLGFNGS